MRRTAKKIELMSFIQWQNIILITATHTIAIIFDTRANASVSTEEQFNTHRRDLCTKNDEIMRTNIRCRISLEYMRIH